MTCWDYWTWRGEDLTELNEYWASVNPDDLPNVHARRIFYNVGALFARGRCDLDVAAGLQRRYMDVLKVDTHSTGQITNALVYAARIATLRGRFGEAEEWFAQARASLGDEASSREDALVAIWYPDLQLRRGNLNTAWDGFKSTLARLETGPRTYVVMWATGVAILGLADVSHARGDYQPALHYGKQALQHFADMEHWAALRNSLASLAMTASALGIRSAPPACGQEPAAPPSSCPRQISPVARPLRIKRSCPAFAGSLAKRDTPSLWPKAKP